MLAHIMSVIADEQFAITGIFTLCNVAVMVKLEHRLTRIETILDEREKGKKCSK